MRGFLAGLRRKPRLVDPTGQGRQWSARVATPRQEPMCESRGPRIVMADVYGFCGTEREAEPVLVEGGPRMAMLTLDDGTALLFDRAELLAALSEKVEKAA